MEQQSLSLFGLGDRSGRGGRPFTSSTTSLGLREIQGGQLNMVAPHSPWGALKACMPDQLHQRSPVSGQGGVQWFQVEPLIMLCELKTKQKKNLVS